MENDARFEILSRHESFQPALGDATAAAYGLVLNNVGRAAPDQTRDALDFIFASALPHMEEEERVVFPKARAEGVPEETLRALELEHRALRTIAEELRARMDEPLDDNGALLLLRFLQSFDAHVNREEGVLASRESCASLRR